MALSTDIDLQTTYTGLEIVRTGLAVKTANTLYQGACVAVDTTGLIPATSTKRCAGFARTHADAGENATIDYNMVVLIVISGATEADAGSAVYATADDTFTLTPNTCIVGQLVDIADAASDLCRVQVTLRA